MATATGHDRDYRDTVRVANNDGASAHAPIPAAFGCLGQEAVGRVMGPIPRHLVAWRP